MYQVTVTDNRGCSGVDFANISSWIAPQLAIAGEDIVCPNSTSFLQVPDTFSTYQWSTGAQMSGITVPPGSYQVTVTNQTNCGAIAFFELLEHPEIDLFMTGDTTVCAGDSATIFLQPSLVLGNVSGVLSTTSGQELGSWNIPPEGGRIRVAPDNSSLIVPGDISITGYPCPVNSIDTVAVDLIRINSEYLIEPISCYGYDDGAVEVIISSDSALAMISWGDTLLSVFQRNELLPGDYPLRLSTPQGCEVYDTIFIDEPEELEPDFLVTPPVCNGEESGQIQVLNLTGGVEPIIYQLNEDIFAANEEFPSLPGGNYAMLIEDVNGCFWDSTFFLSEPPLLQVNLSGETVSRPGIPFTIRSQTSRPPEDITTYTWNIDTSSIQQSEQVWAFTSSNSQWFTLEIIDLEGCSAIDSLWVISDGNINVYTPTAFSPNGDGVNDSFTVYGDHRQASLIKDLRIYDRWGGLVFQGENMALGENSSGWDGQVGAQRAAAGSYVYEAIVELVNGEDLKIRNSFTLLR
jgi:gliding motility-associated-like protein